MTALSRWQSVADDMRARRDASGQLIACVWQEERRWHWSLVELDQDDEDDRAVHDARDQPSAEHACDAELLRRGFNLTTVGVGGLSGTRYPDSPLMRLIPKGGLT